MMLKLENLNKNCSFGQVRLSDFQCRVEGKKIAIGKTFDKNGFLSIATLMGEPTGSFLGKRLFISRNLRQYCTVWYIGLSMFDAREHSKK